LTWVGHTEMLGQKKSPENVLKSLEIVFEIA